MPDKSSQARVAEFGEFVAAYRLPNPLDDKACAQALVRFDQEFFAMLLWGLELDIYSGGELSDADLHFRECLSDLASAVFCAVSRLHKPAMMALRSAVENFVKFTLLSSGQVVDTKSTYELNDRFRAIFSADSVAIRANSVRVLEIYTRLCGYVHSASPDFMSLSISFEEMLAPDEVKSVEVFDVARELSKMFSGLMLKLIGFPKDLHHRHSDYVLDRLPRTLKRAILNADGG